MPTWATATAGQECQSWRLAPTAPLPAAGTGPQVFGNTNAPPAVTHSAIIYSLRCMVTRDIPLNHGCMAPITVCIPPGTLLLLSMLLWL